MDAGVDERADHDSDGERDEQETQRQQFLLPHNLVPPHVLLFAFLDARPTNYN